MKLKIIGPFLFLIFCGNAFSQTTFHGNIARTGVYESAGPKQLGGVKWTFKTNGAIISSPALVGGTVYIGSQDGVLYAVNQETGQQVWKFETGGAVSSSPAVENGAVYFGSSDGNFYALDAKTGALKWKFATAYEKKFEAKGLHGHTPREQVIPDTWDFFTSSPAISNGNVYFGSGDKNVYALDAATGALKWKFATGDVVHASPAIADNTLYIGSFDSNLYALDAASGKEKWRFEAGRDPVDHNQEGFQSSPVIVDGTIYTGCRDAHVYAIDAATGKKKWEFFTDKFWVSNTPAVRGGTVYIGTNKFYTLDAKTGALQSTFDQGTGMFSSPALAGDFIYAGDFTGKLYAIDTKTGKPAWQFQTEGSKRDVLKVLDAKGSYNGPAFNTTFNNFNDFEDMYVMMYKRLSVGSILSSPVVDHGEIYFGSTDGLLYALR